MHAPVSSSLPRTVWYELLFREFPFAKQPPEYIIWRAGNSLKQPLSSVHISKNAKVTIARTNHLDANAEGKACYILTHMYVVS